MSIPHFRIILSTEWENLYRKCFDCHKSFKIKNLVCNIDNHYHCVKCSKKYGKRDVKKGWY